MANNRNKMIVEELKERKKRWIKQYYQEG
jgi:hypothetical protein